MISHIRTSKENKELVTELTNKHSLGAENVIARLAIAHSLKEGKKLDLKNLADSGGKEYSRKVLFGDYENIYLGMICNLYGIQRNDKNLGRLVKLHLDEGLDLIKKMTEKKSNLLYEK
ncbi:DndE family protein [Aequorivita sinensis]|uniref:DndE family protein n=1 Tax=Aequorivita sinensis TaxID=1382458 RepID=UPI0011200019|nr:DndE family protein [Aequorivita sinensis]